MYIHSQFAEVLVINCRIKMVKYFKNAPAPVRFPYLKIVGAVVSFCYKLTIQKSEVAPKKQNKKMSRVGSKVENTSLVVGNHW